MSLLHKTDEYIARRLAWKAAQYSLPSAFSVFYNTLPEIKKEYLSEKIVMDQAEIPMLFFTKPTQEWTLLSTRKLYGCGSSNTYSIALKDIKFITSKKFASQNEKQTPGIRKTEWQELLIIDKNGQEMVFHAHKGSDLFALWNILLMAVRFYRP